MKFNYDQPQIILIGAGIMSATLGVLLKELMPGARIDIYERLDKVGAESSDAWNNAGTGHAAYCELNYTPYNSDGRIDIKKALEISDQFEVSRQFWSYFVNQNLFQNTEKKQFISQIPHLSFVREIDNINYLKERYKMMVVNPLFEGMQFTTDHGLMKEWFPLMMHGRKSNDQIAATCVNRGTDVNFGQLTRNMIQYLDQQDHTNVYLDHQVEDVKRIAGNKWMVKFKEMATGKEKEDICDFLFIGAGGGSLPLIEKSDIPEVKGYGGFPVSGQWLRCTNKSIINQHFAKVYGKAAVGAPPMSVPHLDTRFINGEKALLFGPYAGFSTKFLKNGSYLDLFLSIEMHNVWPLITAGVHNIPLTKYLIDQVSQTMEERMETLREFYPEAKEEDWEQITAGQRVQIIKKEGRTGSLKFGTEVLTSEDGTIATLLGASPGASTSVSIMIDLIKKCFPEDFGSTKWQTKLKEMIPSFGLRLNDHPELLQKLRSYTSETLMGR
jgi:malate dehydrogenase (quinone)